jgi:hypothetical protein
LSTFKIVTSTSWLASPINQPNRSFPTPPLTGPNAASKLLSNSHRQQQALPRVLLYIEMAKSVLLDASTERSRPLLI